MPGYKTHIAAGFGTFIVLRYMCAAWEPSNSLSCEWLLCALLGSLFPDVDITSKGQKIFYRILLCVFAYYVVQQRLAQTAIVGSIALLPAVVRHRGIFHRMWFIIGMAFVVIASTYTYAPDLMPIAVWDALFFCGGALSHIWLDKGFKRMLFNK